MIKYPTIRFHLSLAEMWSYSQIYPPLKGNIWGMNVSPTSQRGLRTITWEMTFDD